MVRILLPTTGQTYTVHAIDSKGDMLVSDDDTGNLDMARYDNASEFMFVEVGKDFDSEIAKLKV